MSKHRHYFKCPQCSEISSFESNDEIQGNTTYETSCCCGIM